MDKAGASVPEEAHLEIRGQALRYVSRGGLKLEKAMENFDVTLAGKICMDVGSSTGGFTDCMLQRGAAKVYAIDVGHGQLVQSLREDPRVVNWQGTDVRSIAPEQLKQPADFFSADVSFISLHHVLPYVLPLLKPAIVTSAILKGVSTYNEYYMANLYLQDKSLYQVVSTSLYTFTGPMGSQYQYICAGVIITMIPILIIFLFCQKQIYSGMAMGAVKE